MNKKTWMRVVSTALCGAVVLSSSSSLVACGGSNKDSIVLMTEELSGLFNPFYATSGTDMDVVGMTQIGMLSTDSEGLPIAGDDEPTVVKAFADPVFDATKGKEGESTYTFVIKNNLKFSDGKPLTMNDVMFNIYEYLDPVYTGSSTMYSIDIKGLSQYRTQKNTSDGGDEESAKLSANAAGAARDRIDELVLVFEDKVDEEDDDFNGITKDEMLAAIRAHDVNSSYMDAVASEAEQEELEMSDYREMLEADYLFALETFKEELESDFKAAKESYDLTTMPYSEWATELSNDIFKFYLYEGWITPKYEEVKGKKNKLKIEKFEGSTDVSGLTKETAINRVYTNVIEQSLNSVLTMWGTSGTLTTKYTADAMDILLHNNAEDDGSLEFPNISGIVSLGHTTQVTSVKIGNETYKVAHEHNADGTPKNADEYDVLQITINGQDPKAIYNFGFTVAPAHYYASKNGTGSDVQIDIKNNKFGVEWASSEFQSKVIQSQQHVEVPVGAGAFMATDENNSDMPKGSEFWKSSVVYFKANHNFMFDVKAEKIRMQVVSPSNALDKLESGEVDYVTPQFTKANYDRLEKMKSNGYTPLDAWQLGYGYIGINAGKVPNINIRRAIMSAMQTSLALEFYEAGTCKTIDWPMSMESWAYPFEDDDETSKTPPAKYDYTKWAGVEQAKSKIEKYMGEAGVSAGDSDLKIKFTIAGASITEHPTYTVFKQAAEILNDMGWDVEVKADSQALTKLSTGSLEVWAAAWGSTIDPDMYQVYHKNSSATSVYAWGYREIKSNTTYYTEENRIINDLSDLIDQGRAITDKERRSEIYEDAMELVLELAVEMPVYQRKNLYAYNSKAVKGFAEASKINPYTSPLEKIWELELVK